MAWTDEDSLKIKEYRDMIDSDDIKIKQKIKQVLLNNRYIIHVLNNPDLDEDEPDTYFDTNILPYYMITPTQTNVQNFICFTTQYTEVIKYNDRFKKMHITFTIMCEDKTIIEKETGLPRHDLLAEFIMNDFNYTNHFGSKIKCISSREIIVDGNYACRELIFEQITDNNLVKTYNGKPRLVNNTGYYE